MYMHLHITHVCMCIDAKVHCTRMLSVRCTVEAAKWNNKNQSKQECVCVCVCVCVCAWVCVGIIQPCKLLNGVIPAQVAMASAVALLSSPPATGVKGQGVCVCGCVGVRACL